MTPNQYSSPQATNLRLIWVAAWVITLPVSFLPDILFTELTGSVPPWLVWAKAGLLAISIGLTYIWSGIRPLRNYAWLLLALTLLQKFFYGFVSGTDLWQSWMSQVTNSFIHDLLSTQVMRNGVAISMIAVLLLLGYKRREFFLVRGQLDAPVEPVRWLGVTRPITWTRFGLILSVAIGLGLLAFMMIAGRPSLASLSQVVPYLPWILLFAASNAFGEEMTYRAALLAPLFPAVGKSQSLLLTAALFGIWHFYGVPYGVIGVVMAAFLGWLLSKSMLETRGFFWPWFIHFVQDVLIFSFIAVGSITPGG
jgi:membrane protease YdiL (CAAX protease family)